MNKILIDSNLFANLDSLSIEQKSNLFDKLGFDSYNDDKSDLVYYDTILYMPIRGEMLTDNLMGVKNIDPYLVDTLTNSFKRVHYYCYDDRINAHRIILLSNLYDVGLAPFGYLLITNLQDFKKAVYDLELKYYG